MAHKLPKYLSGAQVRQLIETLYPHEVGLRAIVGLGLGAGLRVAELSRLRCSEVEIFADGSGRIQVREGKGSRDRVIPVSPWCVEQVKPYLQKRTDGYLFLPTTGPRAGVGPMVPRTIRYHIRRLYQRAGLPDDFSVHTLRHTFAVGWINAQRSEASLQAALGHAHRSTTQVYTEVAPRDVEREVKRAPMEWEK